VNIILIRNVRGQISIIITKLEIIKLNIRGRLKTESPRCCLNRNRRWLRRVSTRTHEEHKTFTCSTISFAVSVNCLLCVCHIFIYFPCQQQATTALRKVVNPHLSGTPARTEPLCGVRSHLSYHNTHLSTVVDKFTARATLVNLNLGHNCT
jgi:hypothetical protein